MFITMEDRMSLFPQLDAYDRMELHVAHDRATGLKALIGLHDTRLGPAIGGCRFYPYATEEEAINDVCRLARGMTYKAALAGVPHGGGKAVIWGDPRAATDRRALFHAFGRFVETLGGRYLTSADSGTSSGELDLVREVTRHVLGSSRDLGGSGDPSPYTALGVRRGIEAVSEVVLGRRDLDGLVVAIQGVGNVGAHLASELHALGAKLFVADVDPARIAPVVEATGARVVSVEEIPGVACDIYAPCALGGAISDATIDRLRCRVVAGAANNQLATPEMGRILHARGIFYAPDFAINAGGLINVAQEWSGYDEKAARMKTLAVHGTIADLAERALRTKTPPSDIADQMVEEILARAGGTPFYTPSPPPTTTRQFV
jgi:leucine dehydrogenase